MNSLSMQHWWDDTDRGKPKYFEKSLSYSNFVHPKSHVDWPGLEPGVRGERSTTNPSEPCPVSTETVKDKDQICTDKSVSEPSVLILGNLILFCVSVCNILLSDLYRCSNVNNWSVSFIA
jgi:hypothetical protein